MHGDADPTVFYAGGTLFGREGFTYSSALETLTGWGNRLGCEGEPVAGAAFDLDPKLPGDETSVLTYSRCARGNATLWTVHGGSHLFANRPSILEKAWLFLNSNAP
jgi:poly(3-hydroxybutyrate) depolymerase